MKKYKYSDEQQKINNVLTYQDEELNHLMHDSQARRNQTDAEIEMLESIPCDCMRLPMLSFYGFEVTRQEERP